MTPTANTIQGTPGIPQAGISDRAQRLADDLTVVIPTYNRSQYFLHYLKEGLWDGIRIHLVCDGCEEQVVEELETRTKDYPIRVISYRPNRGVAHATRMGVASVETQYVMLCGDDDFDVDLQAYLEEAVTLHQEHEELLYVTMPYVQAFDSSLNTQLQYDRRSFNGWTGKKLLRFLVETGEMRALTATSLFRKADIEDIMAEPFFRINEDFRLLCRLCARFPDRRVYVTEKGTRMRFIHSESLSKKGCPTVEKNVMHLVAIASGGYHLIESGEIDRRELARILEKRGHVLQQSYGSGQEAGKVVAALVSSEVMSPSGTEVDATLDFLREHADALPDEFHDVLSPSGVQCLHGHIDRQRTFSMPSSGGATLMSVRDRSKAPFVFAGGSARSGTTLLHMVLCEAPEANPHISEAHWLRAFMSAYQLTRGSIENQIPDYFDDEEDFKEFNASIVDSYLERVRGRFMDSTTVVLKEPEMTKCFAVLHALCPNSKFVCIVRDPRDVVASFIKVGTRMKEQNINSFHRTLAQSRDMKQLGRWYNSYYAPILQHEDDVFRRRLLFVRYEDLVTDTSTVIQNLNKFTGLGLSPTAAQHEVPNTGMRDYNAVQSPWKSDLYGKEITDSRVGTYPEELTPGEIHALEETCAKMMELFGYVPEIAK